MRRQACTDLGTAIRLDVGADKVDDSAGLLRYLVYTMLALSPLAVFSVRDAYISASPVQVNDALHHTVTDIQSLLFLSLV